LQSDLSIALPLAAGFWVVLRCNLLYILSLQLGQAIAVLLSTMLAVALTILSRGAIMVLAAIHVDNGPRWFASNLWPAPFSGTGLGAVVIAVVLAEASVWIGKKKRVTGWIVRTFAGEMTKLLYSSMLSIKPVSITLESRKVYIGFVQGIPSLDPNKSFVRLLPIVSGYRDASTLDFTPTTPYKDALEEAEKHGRINDWIMVIPVSAIKTISLFDRAMYAKFFVPKPKPLVQRAVN
jgi:hypothetical protein